MDLKVPVSLELSEEELKQFKKQTKDTSASASIRSALTAIDHDPDLLAETVSTALAKPEPKSPKKKTSISLGLGDISAIDRIAAKLASSRNAILQLIIKGILSGVMH